MDTNFQTAMLAMQASPIQAPGRTALNQGGKILSPADMAKVDKASKDFESMFIGQFLGSMYQGISTDGPTGGGKGEEMFRSLLIDQYAQSIEKQGGFGLAASVKAEMLKHQQVSLQAPQ